MANFLNFENATEIVWRVEEKSLHLSKNGTKISLKYCKNCQKSIRYNYCECR